MRNIENDKLTSEQFIGTDKKIAVTRKSIRSDYRLHWHDFFEIEIILDGKGIQRLNGREFWLKTGSVYVLTSTDFHEILVEEPLELYNIMFDESILSEDLTERLLRTGGNVVRQFSGVEFTKMTGLAELLRLETMPDSRYAQNLMDCLLLLLLNGVRQTDRMTAQNHMPVFIQKAALYMRTHFRENPPLQKIAACVNLNPSYFCKLFHERMGISPMRYLSELKLAYAKKILEATPLSVTEICFACGYTSVSNFLKAFKMKYGVSPSELRKTQAALKN